MEKYSFFFFLSRAKFALCRENTTGASLLHTAVAAERWDIFDFPKTVSEWWNICKFSDHSKCQEGDGSAPGPHLSSLVGSPGLKWQVCLQFRAAHLICKTWSWDQRWFLCRSALHLAASLRLTDLYSALVERGDNPHILVKKIHFKIISQELTQTYLTATGKPRCCYGKKRWSVKAQLLRELQRPLSTPPLTGATTAGRGSVVGRRRFNTQSFNLVLKRCLPLLDVMVGK